MPDFDTEIRPLAVRLDLTQATLSPTGPTVRRHLSDLEGLFADDLAWRTATGEEDPLVYTVVSTPVPEVDRELPQSITTIQPGSTGDEFWMTKGHQHPNAQAEIYLGLRGFGGLLLFDGERARYLEMAPGVMGYIPAGWAHRSINTGTEPYSFLAVYPGSAGHDYGWVVQHGMGHRVMRAESGYRLADYR